MIQHLTAQCREALVRLFARHFRSVAVPASFRVVFESRGRIIVITQGDSPVIEGLIRSFALRSGFTGTRRFTGEPSSDPSLLVWADLHDPVFLKQLGATDPDQLFTTVSIFPLRGPVRSTPNYRMSWIDRMLLLWRTKSSIAFFGEPFSISPSERAGRRSPLRRIRTAFFKNIRLVRGNPFETREVQAQRIIESDEFQRELRILADKQKIGIPQARRYAYREFYRIAANPLRSMYGLLGWIARTSIRKLFSQVSISGLDSLIAAVRDHTVILVPMHRSHLDYIVLSSTLYDSHLNPPLVVAGMNLNFWPAGFMMRGVGGYFVRRDARQDRIHAVLLKHYVSYLVDRGYMQEFFIEGGRSRSGKMLTPKLGLIGIIVQTFLKRRRRDVLFVPVSITYENVIEGQIFGKENTGAPKRRESFAELLRSGSIFRKKYGDVFVRFGAPLSLAKERAAFEGGLTNTSARDERAFIQRVADTLVRRIRNQVNPSLSSMTYAALLSAPRYALEESQLKEAIHNMNRLIECSRSALTDVGQNTPSLDMFLSGKDWLLADIARGGIATRAISGQKPVYIIPGTRRFTADFYRNSLLHLFFIPGMLSIIELLHGSIDTTKIDQFHRLFAVDMLLSEIGEFRQSVEGFVEHALRNGILVSDNSALRFARRDVGLFCPGFLAGTWQSFAYLCRLAESNPQNGTLIANPSSEQTKDMLRKLLTEAYAARYLGYLVRTEATSQSALASALDTLLKLDAVAIHDDDGTLLLSAPTAQAGLRSFVLETDLILRSWLTESSVPPRIGN